MTVLLGYRLDVTTEELEEIMRIYFLIWEFFKMKRKVPTYKITETDFEKAQSRYMHMLKYVEGESDQKEITNIYTYDLERLKSKALVTAVLLRYNTRPVLKKMDMDIKGIIFLGIRCFIECFENGDKKRSRTL